jgi:hypothetical protein
VQSLQLLNVLFSLSSRNRIGGLSCREWSEPHFPNIRPTCHMCTLILFCIKVCRDRRSWCLVQTIRDRIDHDARVIRTVVQSHVGRTWLLFSVGTSTRRVMLSEHWSWQVLLQSLTPLISVGCVGHVDSWACCAYGQRVWHATSRRQCRYRRTNAKKTLDVKGQSYIAT